MMRSIALAMIVGVGLTGWAFAQTCTSSCSEREATCQSGPKGAGPCTSAKAACMKSGVWVGPNTGKSFPNTCKK